MLRFQDSLLAPCLHCWRVPGSLALFDGTHGELELTLRSVHFGVQDVRLLVAARDAGVYEHREAELSGAQHEGHVFTHAQPANLGVVTV